MHTHLARRADLPQGARQALGSRATVSSTLTLGAVATLWRVQLVSGSETPGGVESYATGQGRGSEAAEGSSTHFSARGTWISLLSLRKTRCFRYSPV